MKKHILILLFCVFAITTNAQTIKSIGLKIGRSNANQEWHYKNISVDRKLDYRSGFFAAINLDLFSRKYLSMATDLAYCQKGYKENILFTSTDMPEGNGTYYEIGVRQSYISLQPLLKFRKENKHFVPYVILGPRIDYQVGYKFINFKGFGNSIEFNKFVFGLTGGAGLEYKFKNYGFGLEYQYLYDFTKILDLPANNNNSITGLYIKNFAMVMMGSFKYYLNK